MELRSCKISSAANRQNNGNELEKSVVPTTEVHKTDRKPTSNKKRKQILLDIGFGTAFQVYTDEATIEKAVKTAVDAGYRIFDCAHDHYNENVVGKALNDKIKEGVVTREELFIISRLSIKYNKEKFVKIGCKRSLKNMKLDYFDAFLMQYPFSEPEGVHYLDTWRGMEACQRENLTRSIGISNFNISQLLQLTKNCTIRPCFHQVEVHVNLNQEKMRYVCRKEEIIILGYSPLGSPAREFIRQRPKKEFVSINAPEMKFIADTHKKTTYQIALKYLIDLGVVPIVKATTENHIRENIDLFDFTLSPNELLSIDTLDCYFRTNIDYKYLNRKEYPFILKR